VQYGPSRSTFAGIGATDSVGIAKLKSAATAPNLRSRPSARPGTRIEAPISKLARVPKRWAARARPCQSRFRETEVCATLVGPARTEKPRLGNAHPDRRNRRHHDRLGAIRVGAIIQVFRMASLHPAVFARAASCRCNPRAYRSANATSVLLPQAWQPGGAVQSGIAPQQCPLTMVL